MSSFCNDFMSHLKKSHKLTNFVLQWENHATTHHLTCPLILEFYKLTDSYFLNYLFLHKTNVTN